MSTSVDTSGGLVKGERDYRRAVIALLAAGLATFNALYMTQALLPTLVSDLKISPTQAALTVSATTGMLAVCIVPASILSERFGRGRLLIISALMATGLGLLLPLAPTIGVLIALRALQGIAIAGVPAVAMTWLSEELNPADLGHAMGIYIAGTSLGGLSGRLMPAALLEFVDWRVALVFGSALGLAFALILALTLPRQRRFSPKQLRFGTEFAAMVAHWSNPPLAALFLVALVGMGAFVSLYNFMGFRMMEDFGLSPALVGAVFLMYLSGTWAAARAGRISAKYGMGPTLLACATLILLGCLATLTPWLSTTLLGLLLFTAAFFAMHSVASSWVGLLATENRAEASSMYLFCYYAGSSLVGVATGWAFGLVSWDGYVLIIAAIVALLLPLATFLVRRA